MKNKYDFQSTAHCIKDKNTEFGEKDIMCWNFEKEECGTLFGNGINWKDMTIDINKVGFINTSPLHSIHSGKVNRNDAEIMNEFIDVLTGKIQTFCFTLEGKFIIK